MIREPYYRWVQYIRTFYDPTVQEDILRRTNAIPLTKIDPLKLTISPNLQTYTPVKITDLQDACILEDAGILDIAQRIDTPSYQNLLSLVETVKDRGMAEVLLVSLSEDQAFTLLESADMQIDSSTLHLFKFLFWDTTYLDALLKKGLLEVHEHYNKELLASVFQGVPIESVLWAMGFGFESVDGSKKLELLYDANLAAGLHAAFTGRTADLPKLTAAALQLNRELQEQSTAEVLKNRMQRARIVTVDAPIKQLPGAENE